MTLVAIAERFDQERFGHDVRTYSERHGLSARSLAEMTGLGVSAVLLAVRGEKMGLSTVCALADVCQLSIDDYVYRSVD